MNNKDKNTLMTILDYCNRLEEHVNRFGNDKDIYIIDKQFQDSCILVIIQIGEFMNRLSDEFINEHKKVPWGEFIGLRNRCTHNYESVINDIIWDVISEDVPFLKCYIEKILYS